MLCVCGHRTVERRTPFFHGSRDTRLTPQTYGTSISRGVFNTVFRGRVGRCPSLHFPTSVIPTPFDLQVLFSAATPGPSQTLGRGATGGTGTTRTVTGEPYTTRGSTDTTGTTREGSTVGPPLFCHSYCTVSSKHFRCFPSLVRPGRRRWVGISVSEGLLLSN